MEETVSVRALLLGERLETRGLERDDTLATNPFTLRVGRQGTAFLFRYGVAVFARLSAIEEDEVVRSLRARIHEPLETPETDQLQVRVNPAGEDQIEPSGSVSVEDASLERLQIIANVLSKSLVLGHSVASVFDRVEPLAVQLQRKGRAGAQAKELLRQIGDVLLTQHRMVGRVEVEEKPDVLWDHPELERLYARLEDEYELVERSRAMERKLALISESASTLIELVHNQRSLRLEWYIIGLIGLELLLSLYGLVSGGLLAAGSMR
jgi:required for meiotic nuclear division protein 1